jgi:hypothetical protein
MLVNGTHKKIARFSVRTITLVLIKFMASDKSDEQQRVMFLPISADWNNVEMLQSLREGAMRTHEKVTHRQ